MATEAMQKLGMRQCFDTLRDGFDAADFADLDDRADKALLCGRFQGAVAPKPAVDLQPLGRQFEQADDGGMAGAEIVDLDIDAERLDVFYRLPQPVVRRIEGYRFQKLEGERAGPKVHGAQFVDEGLVAQALAGDRLVENGLVDLRDDVQAFRHGQESIGRDEAARGMFPAGKRLDADDFQRFRVELRLEEGAELPLFEAAQNIVAQPLHFHRAQPKLVVEGFDAVAALALLGPYSAISALTSSCSADSSAALRVAMPMLAPLRQSCPSIVIGLLIASMSCAESVLKSASTGSRRDSSTNSSPPMRAMKSPAGTWARNTTAACFSTSSPAAWPSVSLISF
ncbi:hypothetical protein DdX_22350 [Ditylenchus destructor]|uniref:Uncharacterized protein n=1 Tax=Ditylenchus destructor TaxID=166010 RepID=A0AAD4MHP2_9BILA|nr:hypothetical protein DdX_22350 [Ditylenchus destructor]